MTIDLPDDDTPDASTDGGTTAGSALSFVSEETETTSPSLLQRLPPRYVFLAGAGTGAATTTLLLVGLYAYLYV